MKITKRPTLKTLLNKLQVEWINGIAKNLRVEARRKREKVELIAELLRERYYEIAESMPEDARKALAFIIDKEELSGIRS